MMTGEARQCLKVNVNILQTPTSHSYASKSLSVDAVIPAKSPFADTAYFSQGTDISYAM